MFFHPSATPASAEIVVSPWSHQSLGIPLAWMNQGGAAASNNYTAVGVVVYVPFRLPEAMTITKLWWANGAAVAGNLDCGVYDVDGNLLCSTGTVAQLNTTTIQVTDITDKSVGRGIYYMGLVSDTSGVTQKVRANLSAAGIFQAMGLLEQAGVTLPLSTGASPATFAKYTRAFLPLFGLQGYRSLGP